MPLSRPLIAHLLAAMLFTGCAGPTLYTVDRTKYPRATVAPAVKKPKSYSYSDATMEGTGAVSSQFGLAGAIVGASIMAVQEQSGKKRVGGAIERSGVEPGAILRETFAHEVHERKIMDLRSPNPETTFHLEIDRWGFGSGGSGLLAASLSAKAELRDRQGAKIWGRRAFATSRIHATHTQFNDDPKLYADAFRDVAETVARKLIGVED